jgi:hypothetical protein
VTRPAAERYVRDNHIREIPNARVFSLEGPNESSLVTIVGYRDSCDCHTLGHGQFNKCDHVDAARLYLEQEAQAA